MQLLQTSRPSLSRPADGARNLLVVDDVDSVRELMVYVLQSEGYSVFHARNSRDALHLHAEFPGTFHVLLTDICMQPHADGFELARTIRNNRPDIRIIFSSGYVDHERLRQEMGASPSLFLPKPFTPAGLIACVRKALAVPA